MRLRQFSTPITIGGFLLSSITGILIFFHLGYNFIVPAHEWLSWVLVIGALFHVISNQQAFTAYLKKPLSLAIIITCVMLLITSILLPISKDQQTAKPSLFDRMKVNLSIVPISTISNLTQEPPEKILNRLREHGISVKDTQVTIQQIALENRATVLQIMDRVFDDQSPITTSSHEK